MAVGVGIWAFIILPKDIQSSRYFTSAQKLCATQRKAREVSEVSWTQGLTILKDGKLWIFAAALFFCGVGSNSSSNFLPVGLPSVQVIRSGSFTDYVCDIGYGQTSYS